MLYMYFNIIFFYYLKDYKERGLAEHQKQLKLLEQELVEMQESYDEMACELFCLYLISFQMIKSVNHLNTTPH